MLGWKRQAYSGRIHVELDNGSGLRYLADLTVGGNSFTQMAITLSAKIAGCCR